VGRTIVFDVSRTWIEERITSPWERGEEIVLSGQHWTPRHIAIKIYEAEAVGLGDSSQEDEAWTELVRAGHDVTDTFLRLPAGSASESTEPRFAADRRSVMVIHGRNALARKAMFEFLRAIDLRPLEWTELVGAANRGAPYIGEVLDAAFERAQAAVVLSTPDDLARLRPDLVPAGDSDRDGEVRGQARPNVFFEAGMAMGRFPLRTVLTELGDLRPASDLTGRHAVRLNAGPECRQDLAQRLENAGCELRKAGTDWLTAGEFVPPTPAPVTGSENNHPSEGYVRLSPRIDALLDDLGESRGYVRWGVAQIYNAIVAEANVPGIPKAEAQKKTRVDEMANAPRMARMTGEEMRTLLNQLRLQL
jgi:predicted nucleotide-binding protein